MTARSDSAPHDDAALRRRTQEVGSELQSAIEQLLEGLPAESQRDQKSLQQALDLSQSVISRLLASIRHADPLTALVMVPGAEALRQMMRGAARAGAPKPALAQAGDAVSAFESLVDREYGDRSTLETVLSDWVSESRAAFELRQKSSAFKAMSAIRGVQADTVLSTGIIHPSQGNADFHDGMGIEILLGCRRVKPSGTLRLNFTSLDPNEVRYKPTSLGGSEVQGVPDLLVPGFSTVQADHVTTERRGRFIETAITGLPLGRSRAGSDIVYAQVHRGIYRRTRGTGSATSGMASHAEPPSEWCVIDALLHDDVWAGIQPELRLYDTVVRGIAHPDDPGRFSDRLDMMERVEFLGRGVDAFRLPEFPRYGELIGHACQSVGWDPMRLRGYRVRVRYPIYGAQIGLAFRLAE